MEQTQQNYLSLIQRHLSCVDDIATKVAMGDRELASDLRQDILVHLWDKMPKLKADADIRQERAWVLQVARHEALNKVRRLYRRHGPPAVDIDSMMLSGSLRADATVCPDDDPYETLQQWIRQLPEGQGDLLLMSLEGRTNKEIAKHLGISPHAVANRLSRLVAKLKSRNDKNE